MAKFAREVVSFEPNSDLWPALRRLLGHNLHLEGVALSDHEGTAGFRYVPDNTGIATIENRNALSTIAERDRVMARAVPMRTLDSYGFDEVSFIKIDVEGHEEAVLEGAKATLARCTPVLLIESEDRHNPGAPQRVAERLAALGYAGFYLRHGKLFPVASLAEDDRAATNLSTPGKLYVNNYIFVPEARLDLVRHIRAGNTP